MDDEGRLDLTDADRVRDLVRAFRVSGKRLTEAAL